MTDADQTQAPRAVTGTRRQWAEPHIVTGHIDGPVITFSDGQMHWLNLRERIALIFGQTTARKLQAELRPDLGAKA